MNDGRQIKIGRLVNTEPEISVVVPCFNVAEFIGEAVESVLAQTFSSYEIVVVNDGSTDSENLEKALEPYFDRIVYITQENAGVASARNAAIEASKGSTLAFLDGDDLWLPDYLESQLNFRRASRSDMVYCDAFLLGEGCRGSETYMRWSPSVGPVTPESLIATTCNVLTSGTICSKEAIVTNGLFDPNANRIEDFDMWFRLSKAGVAISYQKQVLVKYRIRVDGLTGNAIEKAERSIRAVEYVQEKSRLSESEKRICERRMAVYKAKLNVERAKHFIVNERFDDALSSIKLAFESHPKFKLQLIKFLVRHEPRLVRRILKAFRRDEVASIERELAGKQIL